MDHRHLDLIEIAPARWLRWHEAAAALGVTGHTLMKELRDAQRTPSRQRLTRAAEAARMIETHTSGDAQRISNATATEIENDLA